MAASISILSIPDELRKRNVQGRDEAFSIRWASNLIRYFEAESSAQSVNFPAILHINGVGMLDGEVEVNRDGNYAIRLTH